MNLSIAFPSHHNCAFQLAPFPFAYISTTKNVVLSLSYHRVTLWLYGTLFIVVVFSLYCCELYLN